MSNEKFWGETINARIDWSVQTKHCAHCGTDLVNKKIVGSGSFSDGLFCSLDCYAHFFGAKGAKLSANHEKK